MSFQRKRIVVLGSTGSIGVQTLDVISEHPDRFELVGIAAGKNGTKLLEQSRQFGISNIALFEPNDFGIPEGMNAIEDLVSSDQVDCVVVSVAGVIGLLPTLAAIRAKKQIALASKEVLVAAGELIMPLVAEAGISLTPIDSEHSAIFQCIQGIPEGGLEEIYITASGGPFRGLKRADLEAISVQQALNHPTWSMGGKITIDSATLMNKALETIEARWLFDISIDKISAVIHPQSIVHSFVKLKDGSVLAQLGWPNMRLPILYALSFPERVPNSLKPWNPLDTPNLTFEPVDQTTFPSLQFAKEAVKLGGTVPCAMNAANERAVSLFLEGKISFLDIFDTVEESLLGLPILAPNVENLIEIDVLARKLATKRAYS